jgi:outer membrane protein assembly factor BamB
MVSRPIGNSLQKKCCATRTRLHSKDGNVLVYIIVVMLIFAVLGVTMVSLFSTSISSSATANESRRAFYMAESGIRYGMSELRNGNFSTSLINRLNSVASYHVPPSGDFNLKIFSAGFKSPTGATTGSGDNDIVLTTKAGKIPGDYSSPTDSVLYVVNSAYTETDYQNSPPTTARVKGFRTESANSIKLTLADDFQVGTGKAEVVLFAVHPSHNQTTVNVGDSVYLDPAAAKVFPRYNGAVKIHGKTYLYKERVDNPTNVGLRGLNHTVPISNLTTSEFVVLDSGNYYIVSEGKSGNVTYGGKMDYAASAYSMDEPDISGITSGTFNPVVDAAHNKQDFVSFDDAQKTLTIGNADKTFGAAWFKETLSVGGTNNFCMDGRCLFGRGIRVFFVLDYTGTGDGLTFSLINGANNSRNSVGGNFALSELLAYAGDSRLEDGTFLDGAGGLGLRPPKMAIEFDGRSNYQNLDYCADNPNTRNDPNLNNNSRDSVQFVYWGSRDFISVNPPCSNKESSYDDNRHDDYEIDPQYWPFDAGASVRSIPAVQLSGNPNEPTIIIGNNSGANGQVRAIKADGKQKWDPVSLDGTISSSPALDAAGNIYIGTDNGLIHFIYPGGTERKTEGWPFLSSGAVKARPAIDESRERVYVGSMGGKFYAINKSNGPPPVWQYPSDGTTVDPFLSSPVVDSDGTIYVGSGDPTVDPLSGGKLYAFKPNDTSDPLKWTYTGSGAAIKSSPAINPNPAYDHIYYGSSDNSVRAVKRDKAPQWSHTLGTGNHDVSTPAVTSDGLTLYVGSTDGHLYALNTPKDITFPREKWKYPSDDSGTVIGQVISSPAIAYDGTVYFGTANGSLGSLYAVNPNGTLKWKFPSSGDIAAIFSSPTIVNGILYVGAGAGDADGKVYAIDISIDPRNERNLYLTYAQVGASADDNWLDRNKGGPWAVRAEIERGQTLNANGNYDYTLRTWMRKCDPADCDTKVMGTFYEDTRVKYAYYPSTKHPLTQTVELSAADNALFERFLFGFTSAKTDLDNQIATISNFQLSFIRPNDPTITIDPNWP